MPDIFPLASIISQFSGGALEVRLRATELRRTTLADIPLDSFNSLGKQFY